MYQNKVLVYRFTIADAFRRAGRTRFRPGGHVQCSSHPRGASIIPVKLLGPLRAGCRKAERGRAVRIRREVCGIKLFRFPRVRVPSSSIEFRFHRDRVPSSSISIMFEFDRVPSSSSSIGFEFHRVPVPSGSSSIKFHRVLSSSIPEDFGWISSGISDDFR